MRYVIFGAALVALSATATAQDSAWGFFNGSMGMGVQAADGSQLLIKCDQTGKQSVYAVVVATQNLAPPLPENSYQSGPVTLRMDENAPWDDNWHFNGKFALAINRGNTRSLTRLLDKLADAKTFTIEMKPVGKGEIGASFHVAGTKDAVAKVFASCKDTDPLASGAAG